MKSRVVCFVLVIALATSLVFNISLLSRTRTKAEPSNPANTKLVAEITSESTPSEVAKRLIHIARTLADKGDGERGMLAVSSILLMVAGAIVEDEEEPVRLLKHIVPYIEQKLSYKAEDFKISS